MLKDKSCCIKDSKGIQVGKIPQKQGLYQVNDDAAANIATYTGVRVHTADELHQKMGHISLIVIKWLIEQKTVLGLELDTKSEPTFCSTCAKAKLTRKSVPKEWTDYTPHVLGDKIHSDVWGPANPQSYNGKLYYVSFTDDYTRWTTCRVHICILTL